MRIEWYRDLEEIEQFRDSWVSLQETTHERTLYCCFDYIMSWYQCYGGSRFIDRGTPLVGLAYDGDTLIGVAPMVESRSTFSRIPVRRVDCAGYNLAAGELLIRDGCSGVVEAFVDALRDELRFDVVNINGLDIGTERFQALGEHLKSRGVRHGYLDFHSYAIAELQDGYEAYIKSFGWKWRSRLKGKAKKIKAEGDVRIDRVLSTQDRVMADEMCARMIALSESSRRVQRAGVDVDREHQPFYRDIFYRYAGQADVDLAILVIGGTDAAFTFGLIERGIYYHTMMAYNESFAHLSTGTYLFQEVFRTLPDRGIHTVLSHGGYEYKKYWATQIIPQQTVCVFNNTIRGGISYLVGFKLLKRDVTATEDGP